MKFSIATLALLLTAVTAMPADEAGILDKRQCGTVNGPCDQNNCNGCESYSVHWIVAEPHRRKKEKKEKKKKRKANIQNREHAFHWPWRLPQRQVRGLPMRRHLRQQQGSVQ